MDDAEQQEQDVIIGASPSQWAALLSLWDGLAIGREANGRLIDQNCGDSLDVEAMYAMSKMQRIKENAAPMAFSIADAIGREIADG